MGGVTLSVLRDEYTQLVEKIGWLGIDDYAQAEATAGQRAQVLALDKLSGASKFDGLGKVDLAWIPSKDLDGLRVTGAFGSEIVAGGTPMRLVAKEGPKTLVVGSIRMGFGHHRIAFGACTWGLKEKAFDAVYFHDLLSVDADEANLIRDSDKVYRASSKLATEIGGPFEWIHGAMTSSGDVNSLRTTALVAAKLTPLVRDLPRDCAFIASHSLVALTVILANVTQNVVNLVIDNHPQWFVVVPKGLNLVQGPRNYYGFVAMTGDANPDKLRIGGHWIPEYVVSNIEEDCARREKRRLASKPLRILIPIGGAGAQRAFITSFVTYLAADVKEGKVKLVLNAGDHEDIREALSASLQELGLSHTNVTDMQQARDFAQQLREYDDDPSADAEKEPAVTLMAFTENFPAVEATDTLIRSVDVLASKPSELAFYPVPKLMIRRVGDHEFHSASRANELGEGTEEIRKAEDAAEMIKIFNSRPDPLVMMNRAIVGNAKNGIYDGGKSAAVAAAKAVTQ